MCVCMCVCVCVYVFISSHRIGFSSLNKAINVMTEVQVSDGILRKYFCVKCFYCLVIYHHSRNLDSGNCAKECQLNRAEPRELKENL